MKDGVISESGNAGAANGGYGGNPSTRLSGSNGFENDNKVKKVKLKVGGVTRTIQANSAVNGTKEEGSSTKLSRSSDVSRQRQKQNLMSNSDNNHSPFDKKSGLKGIPWKDFSRSGISLGKDQDQDQDHSTMGRISGKNISGKEGDNSEPVRKSKRVPKKRVLDGEFGEDEEDDEIRYLEKLKSSKATGGFREEDDEESSRKHRKLSVVSSIDNVGASRSGKDLKRKSRTDRVSGDTDYEEEDLLSDGEVEGKKKQKKEAVEPLSDGKRELALTTRQRALQSSKDASSSPGSSLIEFPKGLPPAAPRKQKEKSTEYDQQVKKAEAAQRRRMQIEKATRESEEEAIKKIRGQDSSRKKKEDKIKKRQEELAQEKAANALALASSTIRYVMAPNGTTVTFPDDMGLPSLFDPKPCRNLKKLSGNRKSLHTSPPVKAVYDEFWAPSSREGIWSIREDLQVPSSPYFPAYAQGQGPPPMVQERFQSVISQLFQHRIIRCGGAVDDDMANIIVAQLLYLDAVDPKKDIVMYVNSPGGSVTAGMAIFDTMRHIRPDVSTVCVGLAASMGAFLLSAGTKGKRYSLPNSRIMIHQPLGGAQGGQTDIDIQANEMLHHKANLNGYLSYHTGQSLAKINQDTDRDFFMSAKEAKEYGLIDGVILNPLKALQPLPVAAVESTDESSEKAAT